MTPNGAVRTSSSTKGNRARRRLRCRKHASARSVPDTSSSAAAGTVFAFVNPDHTPRTAANTYDNASRPSVGGDDPVNGGDPTGLASGCDNTNGAKQAACLAGQRAAAAANAPHCPAGSRIVGGQCTGTGAGQPCPSVNSTTGACNSAAWNANNPFDAGVAGVCVGGGLVTPWGGVVGSVCLVSGDGQIGVTATGAAGSSVRGLYGGIGISGFTSMACSVHDLSGKFTGGGFGSIVTPWGGSYLTGNSADGPVSVTGVEGGFGGGGWGGTTDTATASVGSNDNPCCQ